MAKTAAKTKTQHPAIKSIRSEGHATPEIAPEANAVRPVIHLPLHLRHDQIVADPDNAREDFDPDELAELAETLFSHGLKSPMRCLIANPEGRHQLMMGERRWRAWGLLVEQGRWSAEHTELCMIEDADELTRLEAGLIENLQRVNLNHMEAGLGFEKLATRCGRSNKQIAEAVGRTAEYVQQHRRLAGLDADDQARVRAGALSMHEALRVLSQPKPEPLTALEMMILAEVVHHVRTNPRANSYGGEAEVSYKAGGDPVLKALVKRSFLRFTEKAWQNKRAYVVLDYQARNLIAADFKALGPPKDMAADMAVTGELLRLRRAALSEADYETWALGRKPGKVSGYPMVCEWLNGPFELSAQAAAEVAADKASKAADRDKAKVEKAKRAAYCAEAVALDAEIRKTHPTPIDARLPDLFRRGEIALPVRVERNRILDAKGASCLDANWRFGEHQEAVLLACALAINAATGYGAGSTEPDPPTTLDAPDLPPAEPFEAGAGDAPLTPAMQRLAGITPGAEPATA